MGVSNVSDLVAFLTARLDEDVAAASAAWAPGGPPPLSSEPEWLVQRDGDSAFTVYADVMLTLQKPVADMWTQGSADHVARHDPARVLREVDAKRGILERYLQQYGYDLPDGAHDGRDPDERATDEAVKDTLLSIVQGAAAVYRDHPDYDPAWADPVSEPQA